jgi:hypothetical protein
VRVYAVWVSILPSDFEIAVRRATNKLPDERVSHYWDGNGVLVKDYARILQAGDGKKAWDVYFVYDRDAEWKDNEPPVPAYWMHQIDLAPERELDGEKLAAEMKKMLEGKK